jgi:translocation and assembly module TamA
MGKLGRAGLGAGLLAATLVASVAPVLAFELFGIRLWGSDDTDDGTIEIIDPLPYSVSIRVEGGDEELEGVVENASALWGGRDEPASGKAGLLSRARGDYRRILAALYGEGHYGGEISIRIDGREVSGLTLDVELAPRPALDITVRPGPLFSFGQAGFVNPPVFTVSDDDEIGTPASVGFATGEPARARVIGSASALAVEQWRQLGHPKAAETGRDVLAEHPSATLDVSIRLDPGRAARFGRTRVEGSSRTDPGFIAYMADIPEGAEFDPDAIDASRDRLTRLGVFRSIRIEEADEIAPDGSLPMTVVVEDRRPRTIGFGATLSTIDGLGLEAYWQHRNLFGRAERIRFAANIENLGVTSNPDEFNYSLGVTFTKPGAIDPDTDFVAALVALQNDFDTYRETSVTARAGFQRQFGDEFSGSLFAQASRARYEDDFGTRNFTTFGIQGRAEYDRRRVDPLNAVEGYYLAADVIPFYEAEFGNPALRATLEGRTYYSLDADSRYVLAGRALVGSYLGPDAAESPPDLLFFTGGGGSVRGYAFRSIGIDVPGADDETSVIGGRGLLEGSLEFRVRLNESFGVVGFVDSGYVTEDPDFQGATDLRTGVGLGVRYFTPIGAIRADLATPVDPRDDDSLFGLYIGIGQAF